MRSILFCVALLSSHTVFSADWDPFPYQQKLIFSYKDQSSDTSLAVNLMDSIRITGQDTIMYFQRNVFQSLFASCDADSLFEHSVLIYYNYIFNIDSLVQRNDTLFYHSNFSASDFYFLPNATPGQSWTVTSTDTTNDYTDITFTCQSYSVESFCGVSDSVKIYSMHSNGTSVNQIPVDSFIIKLSKMHGFIEFIPFRNLMHHPASLQFITAKLIGYDKMGISGGFHFPGFSDYFHLHQGDILLWRHHVHTEDFCQPVQDYSEYYRDSITQEFLTSDSVVYSYDRIYVDTSGNILSYYQGLNKKYLKNGFEYIFGALPGYVGFGDNEFCYHYPLKPAIWSGINFKISVDSSSDTITTIDSWGGEYFFDSVACGTQYNTNLEYSFKANTIAGITNSLYHIYDVYDYDYKDLLGYRINGQQYGNIVLSTANIDITSETINIYPNPVDDIINLGSVYLNNSEFRIINAVGQCVGKGIINDQKIDIRFLQKGIYFIEIINPRSRLIKRFIKS